MRDPVLLPDDTLFHFVDPPATDTGDTTGITRRAVIYYGVQAEVAKRLGVSRAHVSLVARGRRFSKRVLKAVAEVVRERERRAA